MSIRSKLFCFAVLCLLAPLLFTFVLSFGAATSSLNHTVNGVLISQAQEQLNSILRRVVADRGMHETEQTEFFDGTQIDFRNRDNILQELKLYTVFGGHQDKSRQIYLESIDNKNYLYSSPERGVPYDVLTQTIQSGETIAKLEYQNDSFIHVSVDSRSHFGSNNPNWRLHVLLDTDVAYGSVIILKNLFLLSGTAVLCLSFLVGYAIYRSLVKPVSSLINGTEHLAAGNYDYELPYRKDQGEIGFLTSRFIKMRTAVRDKEKQLLSKTRQAEGSARLKGELLADMSHEVRTPINAVLGMAELLLNTELEEKQAHYAKTISRSGNALLSVINNVLDYSKIEAGKFRLTDSAFDLRDLAEDVAELVADGAQRRGIEVVLQMSPGSATAFIGDGDRLRQVLTNLMGNAVKFTEKGEVRLEITYGEQIGGKTPTTFMVADTGIGIEEDQCDKIFESFVQADGSSTGEFGGTGLGLSISSSLVKLMGGEIKAVGKPGVGATFWFTVYLSNAPIAVHSAWHSQDALSDMRILIVDDNDTNLEILEKQVSFWGGVPTLAGNAEQGLVRIEEFVSKNTPFDAMILDVQMPGTSGLELARLIHDKKLAGSSGVLLLSSSSDIIDTDCCRELPIYSVANKPVRQTELYRSLIATIEKRRASDIEPSKVVRKLSNTTYTGRVLLVEDNPVNQDMMLEMLRIIGVDADLVVNGQEAVEATATAQYDLVLMDCEMPVLDGFSATRDIRLREVASKSKIHQTIVALTANAMQGTREQCLSHGMDGYLSKPVSSKQLRDVLNRWIGEPVESSTNTCVTVPVPAKQSVNSMSEILDEKIFNEVFGMCCQSGDSFFESLVSTYEESFEADFMAIEEALREKDGAKVGTIAHRLKSGSASWGATVVTGLLQTLENAGKNDDLEATAALMVEIGLEQQRLIQELRARQQKAA